MKINADGYLFEFPDALDVFIFDEKDKSKRTYHGVPMKAVDVIAEFSEYYIFIEIKHYDDPSIYDIRNSSSDENEKSQMDHFKWLKNYLKYKYRDSYLFRHAERKVDKPIHYMCLLNFDNGLNMHMQKILTQELPVGKASKRWKAALVDSCHVFNLDRWNKNFPKWPLSYTG
ncbi:MAG: hypothetical protein J1E80_00035 [Desulfovibrionaceae bacterium]|nr:hypothetical protein [Desulfovibrionaceae bacterium]